MWTLTNKLENTVDVFQRSLLRRILKISWKDKITNDELYEKTKAKIWSNEIKRRRSNWFGHMMRLPEETPAKQALEESEKSKKTPRKTNFDLDETSTKSAERPEDRL